MIGFAVAGREEEEAGSKMMRKRMAMAQPEFWAGGPQQEKRWMDLVTVKERRGVTCISLPASGGLLVPFN